MRHGLKTAIVLAACFSALVSFPSSAKESQLLQKAASAQSTTSYALSTDDLAFGESQVRKLLADRPTMANFVKPSDKLWNLVAEKFAGIDIGHRVRWNCEQIDKPTQYIADHKFSSKGDEDCYIRLRKIAPSGRPYSGEELWAALFYEFENLRNRKSFYSLYEKALKGLLSKEQWVTENTMLEYNAQRRTSVFYEKIWVPLMVRKKIKSNSSLWGIPTKPTYEEWIKQYDTSSTGDYDYWADYYDSKVIPYLRQIQLAK